MVNTLTSIFVGFIVFAYVGYVAYTTQQRVQDVIKYGPGFAFIMFPFAMTKIAGSPFWSIMWFLMMLTLGINSQFNAIDAIITSITDLLPRLRKQRIIIAAVLCISLFLLGLPHCTRVI